MVKRRSTKTVLDLSFMTAATILARRPEEGPTTIMLVGCGGTGSYMAESIGRLLRALGDSGVRARALFVDHDTVQPQNIGRQLFCEAELGANKATALALRYSSAWGVDITALPQRFTASMAKGWMDAEDLLVLVGCVDNAAARKELARAVKASEHGHEPDCECAPGVWWLDCGNHEDAGQVLLGSSSEKLPVKKVFPSKTICHALPAPSVQRPELLVAKRLETSAKKMSCAELAVANHQSLNINNRVAAEAADILTRLLLTRNLKRYACEINLAAGSVRSSYASPTSQIPGVIA